MQFERLRANRSNIQVVYAWHNGAELDPHCQILAVRGAYYMHRGELPRDGEVDIRAFPIPLSLALRFRRLVTTLAAKGVHP